VIAAFGIGAAQFVAYVLASAAGATFATAWWLLGRR
jgi:hypothetical protein